jgi:hypothetical protein
MFMTHFDFYKKNFIIFIKLFESKSYSKNNPISVFLLEQNGERKIDSTLLWNENQSKRLCRPSSEN